MNTIICNLFAGPGSGKSTLASGLFYELKMRGHNVELAPEYAKELVWAERQKDLTIQPYVFGKQYHRIARLLGKVEAIITDSPILLCQMYAGENYPQSFHWCIKDLHDRLNNINYFVVRCKEYNPIGRNQTEEQAIELDECVHALLMNNNIKYDEVDGTAEGLRFLVDDVQKVLEKK